MLSGHTLYKVIGITYINLFFTTKFIFLLPMMMMFTIVTLVIFLLETAVAFVQAFIFTMMVTIYINDILYLH